jgi:quinolinate synthase
MNGMVEKIRTLAAKRRAVILAHNYQRAEVQDIADHTGDSYELSRIAASSDAEVIVFCGVHFMAESAKILSPKKTVLIPDPEAGCPMADMIDETDLLRMRGEHPDAGVVLYINSTAAAKAVADTCCTSSNAIRVTERMPQREIIFAPDRNLASWVARHTSKIIIPADGFCPTHERITVADIDAARTAHPEAVIMVHPECRPEVVNAADNVFSTGEMVAYAATAKEKTIIVGTESGIIHRLQKASPGTAFLPLTRDFICPNMKKITPDKILHSLETGFGEITLDDSVIKRAEGSLRKMLELAANP